MNNQEFDLIPDEIDVNTRIDSFLSDKLSSFTRSRIQNLIESENITVNNKAVSKSYKIKLNDVVHIIIPECKDLDILPENIHLDIVYEDDDLLVVNKPKGMVVHPAAGNTSGTLVNALMYHCKDKLSGINGVNRPGIVHRIDKNTSGLLVVAKNDYAHNFLAEQFSVHNIEREYHAIVYGNVKNDKGTIDAPIGRHPLLRKQMAITDKNSKKAITHYEVIERLNGFTYIKCHLETGRTHQIRVHMASIGHPLAGDDVYGPKKVIKSLEGQCLHAKALGFTHPKSNEQMFFDSLLPEYFLNFLNKLRKITK